MPRDTFFNLPEEKRKRIMDAAIDEFANHPFHKATISRIVQKADIPKGSFYQYFKNKKDLFTYIVSLGGDKKFKHLNRVIENAEVTDFFKLLRYIYLAGIEFAKENPKLAMIGEIFMRSSDSELKQEILDDTITKAKRFLKDLLEKGIENGDIDPRVDVEVVSMILTSYNVSLTEYFFGELDTDNWKKIKPLIDGMLYVLENGIKNKHEDQNQQRSKLAVEDSFPDEQNCYKSGGRVN